MAQKVTWIDEAQASDMMGLTTKYFRESVQKRKFLIAYSKVSRNKIVYALEDIQKHIYEHSTLCI